MVLLSPAIPDHLRGYISRFLVEPRPNIFVGNCSWRVMDRLWDRAIEAIGEGSITLIHSDPTTEQGFAMRFHGDRAPEPVNLDGYMLVARLQPAENQPSVE